MNDPVLIDLADVEECVRMHKEAIDGITRENIDGLHMIISAIQALQEELPSLAVMVECYLQAHLRKIAWQAVTTAGSQ